MIFQKTSEDFQGHFEDFQRRSEHFPVDAEAGFVSPNVMVSP